MSVGYDRIARDIAFTLEVKSPNIFEGIFLNNGVLAMMGMKGRVKVVKGGNRFDERTRLGQNSNVGHRDKFAKIPTTFQNNVKTAYYGHSVASGAAMVNLVEQDQNAGPSRIDELANDAIKECMNTFPNEISDALMAGTSDAVSPTSIKETLVATANGSQTTPDTGNIARASYPGTSDKTAQWQTQYTNSSADLASAAGIATVSNFIHQCAQGGGALSEKPDIALTTIGVLARATGGADILRRYTVNDKMLKLGFDNIMIHNCTLIADRNAATSSAYFLNTNYAHVQVLGGAKTKKTQNLKVIGDGKTSVPLQVRPAIESYNELNYAVKMYLVYNLTFGALRNHGLMDNLTQATA